MSKRTLFMDRDGWREYGYLDRTGSVPTTGDHHPVDEPKPGDSIHNGLSTPGWQNDIRKRGLSIKCVHRAMDSNWDVYQVL